MTNSNLIKKAIRSQGLSQWQIAEYLGISEWTLCRWLRSELPEQRYRDIVTAIDKLSNAKKKLEGGGDNGGKG